MGRRAGALDVDIFETIVAEMADCVLLHRRGTILFANRAWSELLAYPSADVFIGRNIFEYIHPDDRAMTRERLARIEQTREELPPAEVRVLRRDGTSATVELAPVRQVDVEGEPANLVVARDVSPRRHLQEQLLVAHRVSSMGRLAAGVAHEINNPLTYVIGNLSVAAKGLSTMLPADADPNLVRELEKAIADARAGAERVRHIVGDLSAFSRPDRGDESSHDLRRVLDTAINMGWTQIRHRAQLVREFRDVPAVRGSPTRMGQLFLNLLLNAAQAIEEGDAQNNTICVGTSTDAEGRAVVSIHDTGAGIPEHVRKQMWEPFFTTKGGEGTGLGLSVCQSIVTSMGGEITAAPSDRFNTVFSVTFPPATVSSPEMPAPLGAGLESELLEGRVLVVDDEPVVATLVRRALEPLDVYIMTSGRDALELIRELDFDVIVCDVIMPDVSGMDLYERVRSERPGLERRVVFMTAGVYTKRESNFLNTVENPVVEKPFDLDVLNDTVQAVLRANRV